LTWDGAQSREFNIGIAAEREPRFREFKLSPIADVAAVSASVVITVYAPQPTPRPNARKKTR
jgi:hypothetical protein